MPIRDLVLLAFFVTSLPFCFVRPFYGILLWTIVAFLNPQSFIWGAASFFPWALAVAIPTLLGFVLFSKGWNQRLATREVYLIGILWIWFTITSVVSVNTPLFMHHSADTWDRWRFVSKVLLMTIVTVALVDSLARLRILLLTIAGCFGFYVAKSFPFIISTRGAFRLFGPANSMIADNNDLGLALNMTLPFFFFLAQSEDRPWVKRLFTFLFFISIPAIFFTYSRGALVGLIANLALMFLQLRFDQKLLLAPVICVGLAVAIFFAPQKWKDRMDFTSPQMIDGSAQERLNSWAFARHLARDYPITGGGFGTFTPELFERYAPNGKDIKGPHSIYFGLLAEHGVIGLGLYLTLVISCLFAAHRLARAARFYGDGLILNYINLLRFSMVGFLTSGVFLGRAYFDYYFTLVACIAILRRVADEEWARDEEAAEEETTEPEHPEMLPQFERSAR